MNKLYLGQDVLYISPTNKEECAAKVVRIVDRSKQTVNLIVFTDHVDTEIARNVPFDETNALASNTWRHNEQHEQARSAGVGSSR